MKCKKCGHEEFEYTESYKGKISILIKIPYVLLMIIFFMLSVTTFKTGNDTYITLLTIMFLIGIAVKIYEKDRIRKSHTKAICKKCGNIKYID